MQHFDTSPNRKLKKMSAEYFNRIALYRINLTNSINWMYLYKKIKSFQTSLKRKIIWTQVKVHRYLQSMGFGSWYQYLKPSFACALNLFLCIYDIFGDALVVVTGTLEAFIMLGCDLYCVYDAGLDCFDLFHGGKYTLSSSFTVPEIMINLDTLQVAIAYYLVCSFVVQGVQYLTYQRRFNNSFYCSIVYHLWNCISSNVYEALSYI